LLDADWLTNLPRFREARPDHARVESSSCCFPRELVSFVRPRELVLGFTLEAKLVSSKLFTQVNLKISNLTLENLASHLMKKCVT